MQKREPINKKNNDRPPKLKIRANLKVGLLCSELQALYYRDRISNPTLASHWQSELIQRRCEVGAPQYP